MPLFVYGKTEKCCECYKKATNWYGWLRKSRDGIVAGFCDEHNPNMENKKGTYGNHNLIGIYNKNMGMIEPKSH